MTPFFSLTADRTSASDSSVLQEWSRRVQGDFDEAEHLGRVSSELAALARSQRDRRYIAVYPENMEEVTLFDGRGHQTFVDAILHAKLIDALGALVGQRCLVVNCLSGAMSIQSIETAKSALRGMLGPAGT